MIEHQTKIGSDRMSFELAILGAGIWLILFVLALGKQKRNWQVSEKTLEFLGDSVIFMGLASILLAILRG